MKYLLIFENCKIEFIDKAEAIQFCQDNNLLKFEIVSESEFTERILAKKKREFGLTLSNDCIELLGARNKILSLTSSQVTSMLTNLAPIRALLETGALGTARSALGQLKLAYTSHSDIFDSVILKVNLFEQENGL
jgi:hypothetical protein